MAGRPRQFDETEALQGAMEVFWRKGYEAAGVRELLDAMGVCRQSFYDTFGDKRQLFLRAIERYCSDAEGWFREQLEGPGPALENLRSLLKAKAAGASDKDCRGCLAMNTIVEWGGADDDVAQLLRQNLKRVEKMLAATLERAQEEGDLDPTVDTRPLASFLLFVCLGYAALDRLRLSPKMAQNVLETALGVLPETQPA